MNNAGATKEQTDIGLPAPPPDSSWAPSAATSVWPGERIVTDHELIRRVGRGSFGEVWLARNVIGTYRAVKLVFRPQFEDDQPYEREFKGIQKFEPVSRSHDGFVDILQVARNDHLGCFYYVMELADDGSESRLQATTTCKSKGAFEPPAIPLPTYEPKTLRSELRRRGQLPVAQCLSPTGNPPALPGRLPEFDSSGNISDECW